MSNTIQTSQQPNINGYQVIKLLGQGGMGAVYLAEDKRLQRKVAIKVLNESENSAAKTLIEARTVAQINHPNVVQIYDIVEGENHKALVMEYLEGETLSRFQRKTLLTIEQKLELLIQMSSAMQTIHQAGFVHADVKAANIWITKQHNVKVLDLGIARPLSEPQSNSNEASFGSSDTASPEQLRGEILDQQSDIYSYGVIAFELFAGRSPFKQITLLKSGSENDTRLPAEDAHHIFPKLPPALIALLNQMLSEDKKQRPLNFKSINLQLQQILADSLNANVLEQQTAPLPVPEKKVQKTWFKPSLLILLILFTGLIIGSYSDLLKQLAGEKPNERFVAVLSPAFTASENIAIAKQNQIIGSVDDAIRQTILNANHFHLLPRNESLTNSRSIKEIGNQLAATDVITTDISCTQQKCEIRLDHITSENWSVIRQKHWIIHHDSAFAIYQEISARVNDLFPNEQTRLNSILLSSSASEMYVTPEQYQAFAALYARIMIHGEHSLEALDELKELITHGVSMNQAYDLYRWLALSLYEDRKDPEIMASFQTILESSPAIYQNSIPYLLNQFWIALYLDNIELAKQTIDTAAAKGATPYEILGINAAYHLHNNEFEQAAAFYQQRLQLRLSANDLYNLSLCYWLLGEATKAEDTLNQLLAIHSIHYHANQLLASIYLLQGNINKAIDAYQRLISENPYSMDLNNLAIAYMLQREFEQARNTLIQAVKQSPDEAALQLNLADALTLLGDIEAGKTHYTKVLELQANKESMEALLDKSQAYAHLGNARMAISLLNQATKLSPESEEVAFTSALVYQILEEPLFAITKAEEAVEAGLGSIWFTLPWFDNLCSETSFQKLFTDNLSAHCQIAYASDIQ